MPIWSTDYINQLDTDAGLQISTDLNCIYNRSYLATTSGKSVYALPCKLRSLLRITWRGYKLDPLNWEAFTLLTPNTVVLSESTKVEGSISRPFWYTIHPTNLLDIRFYPTPNETFDTTGDPFSPLNEAKCIVSYYQLIETASLLTSLPSYVDRRTRKAYVLWQAFSAEGKGQNLKAAEYYRGKYFFLINRFRMINQGCYVSKRYSLSDNRLTNDNYRYPRPMLPPRYERRMY